MTTTDAARPVMATHELLAALRDHFIKPGERRPGAVFLTEVTAPDRVHRADAVHVGLWASRGHTVDVCELKTSRADFQRELDKPEKAEAWWRHSNTFWIVAPSVAVAPPDLLPTGWGLMVRNPGARRFKVVVKAEHRDLQPSTALLARLLVSTETDRENALQAQRQTLDTRRRREVQDARREGAMQGFSFEVREQLKRLAELEALIGFRLDYDGPESVSVHTLAAAIRDVVIERKEARELDYVLKNLARDAADLAKSAERARKNIAERTGEPTLLPDTESTR